MRKKRIGTALLLITMLGGCAVSPEVQTGEERFAQVMIAEESIERLTLQRKLALWYNHKLRADTAAEELASAYENILFYTDGAMGTLSIPKIGVTASIYHGVQVETLEKRVGHMQTSAFPIGGEDDHTVLVLQTGWDAEVDEEISVEILGEKIRYSVTEISERTDFDSLQAPLTILVRDGSRVSVVLCRPLGEE